MISSAEELGLWLAIATAVGGFTLAVVRKLTENGVEITAMKDDIKLILNKLDQQSNLEKVVAVVQNDIKTLYKATERNSENAKH
ncbi:MAG: hypothetical protein JKY81_01510 [Colwellia sp.]|nr:hypothetical protein [Colwellia sp.]